MSNRHAAMTIWTEPYADDGKLRPQDATGLDEFLGDQDRSEITGLGVPFFSGRNDQINAFRQSVRKLASGRKSNATIVVEGPPGCGKSALLMQYVAELNRYPAQSGREWLPVVLDGANATSPAEIMRAVDDAIARKLAQQALQAPRNEQIELARTLFAKFVQIQPVEWTFEKLKDIDERGFAAFGLGIGAKTQANQPTSITELPLIRGSQWDGWNIVLLIDEAQHIDPTHPNSNMSTLSSIHQGMVNLPIIFCAFGLPDTPQVLRKVGVSRPSSKRKFKLAGLSDNETQMAVNRAFRQFDLRQSGQLEQQIVSRSNGWPQHLTVYLNAVLSAARPTIESQGHVNAAQIDIAAVLSDGDQMRRSYYEGRIESLESISLTYEGHAKLLAQHLIAANGPTRIDDAIRLLVKERAATIDQASTFLTEAMQCGLLAKSPDGSLLSPIPSFLAYLASSAQQHSWAEKPKGLTR
ncbi:MAG: ATP-binding protein [Gammaproteobacteria bacterium]|nr:ATP-binding protein [Gammaproteobacteria bacterium]